MTEATTIRPVNTTLSQTVNINDKHNEGVAMGMGVVGVAQILGMTVGVGVTVGVVAAMAVGVAVGVKE